MTDNIKAPVWGLLPAQVKNIIQKKEWENSTALKARLLGVKAFPLKINLKPPTGKQAKDNLPYFQQWVREWKNCPLQDLVRWNHQNLAGFSTQNMPVAVEINSFNQLVQFLGKEAASRTAIWERNFKPLLNLNEALFYPALIKNLKAIERLPFEEVALLAKLLPQLEQGMGRGQYLRALPLIGVDTKFVETHLKLIQALADTLHNGEITRSGGLPDWLGCIPLSRNCFFVKPLCASTEAALASGWPLVKLRAGDLRAKELPSANILVVENEQPGLALPAMGNTIAVMGGGRNVSWLDAAWLAKKRVGYWGDIDTWGVSFLNDARRRCPNIQSLMMDVGTIVLHQDRLVTEPFSCSVPADALHPDEMETVRALTTGAYASMRLEQERLSADYIRQKLFDWLSC